MKKKLLSLLLALCMILSACVTLGVTTFATGEALTAQAITDAVTAKTGTININSQTDWDVFADADKSYTYEGVTIELNTSVTDTAWTPIASFAGNLNGNGNTIKGLVSSGSGLFTALVGNVQIQNVVFEECSVIRTSNHAGLIVATLSKGVSLTLEGVTLKNCTVISKNSNGVGGFVGAVTGAFVANNCHVIGGKVQSTHTEDNGNMRVGGFVGVVWDDGDTTQVVPFRITNCTNSAEIIGTVVGGILGNNRRENAWIENCQNSGSVFAGDLSGGTYQKGNTFAAGILGQLCSTGNATVKGCSNSGTITVECLSESCGTGFAAGIVACCDREVKIENCINYATGTVTSNGTTVGGIAAKPNTATFLMDNCQNFAEVKLQNSAKAANVGGLFGIPNNTVTVKNSTNYGKVSSTATANEVNIGGIAGQINKNITLMSCTNAGEVASSGAVAASNVGGIVGVINAAFTMKDCENNGNVSSTNSSNTMACVGGIVGNLNVATTFSGYVNNGDVTSTGATYQVNLGGIVGNNNKVTTISNCVNTGNLSLDNDSADSAIGGIVGKSAYNMTVANCVNKGVVDSSASSKNVYAGGIAGYADQYYKSSNGEVVFTFRDCVSAGDVKGKNKAGGLVAMYLSTVGYFENCIVTGKVYVVGDQYSNGAFIAQFKVNNTDPEKYITFKNCYYLEGLSTASNKNSNYNAAMTQYNNTSSTQSNIRVIYTATDVDFTFLGGTHNKKTGSSSLSNQEDIILNQKLYNAMFTGFENANVPAGTKYHTGAMVSSADALKGVAGLKLLSKAGYDVVNTWTMAADGTFVPTALAAGEKKTPDADLAISYKGYQMGTVGTESEGCIRLIAGMNAIDGFAATGFDVVITENGVDSVPSKPLTTTTVYESLWADGVNGAVKASELGCTYLSALSISNMPADCIITLTATLTPIEGEVVKGTTVVIVVEDGAVVAQYAI